MGQNQTKDSYSGGQDYQKILENYTIKDKIIDPRFQEAQILVSKTSDEELLVKEIAKNEEVEFKKSLDEYRKKIDLKHPNILQLIAFVSKSEAQFCSTFFKSYLVFQYSNDSLDKQIISRQQMNQFYLEDELWGLIEMAVSALAFLQDNNISHNDIRPYNIFITKQGIIKIADNQLLNSNSSYAQVLSNPGNEQSGAYQNHFVRPDHDPVKSDVFSLGMTLLHAASLQSSDDCYSYANYEISQEKIKQRLAQLSPRYSFSMIEFIRSLLEFDESKRPTFVDLRKSLEDSKAPKMPSLQQQQLQQSLIKTTQQYELPVKQQVPPVEQRVEQTLMAGAGKFPQFDNTASRYVSSYNVGSSGYSSNILRNSGLNQSTSYTTTNPLSYQSTIQYDEINNLLKKYGIEPIHSHQVISPPIYTTSYTTTTQTPSQNIQSQVQSTSSKVVSNFVGESEKQQKVSSPNQRIDKTQTLQSSQFQSQSQKQVADASKIIQQQQPPITTITATNFQIPTTNIQIPTTSIKIPNTSNQIPEQKTSMSSQQFSYLDRPSSDVSSLTRKVDEILASIRNQPSYSISSQQYQLPSSYQPSTSNINVDQILREARENQEKSAFLLQQYSSPDLQQQFKNVQLGQTTNEVMSQSKKSVEKARELLSGEKSPSKSPQSITNKQQQSPDGRNLNADVQQQASQQKQMSSFENYQAMMMEQKGKEMVSEEEQEQRRYLEEMQKQVMDGFDNADHYGFEAEAEHNVRQQFSQPQPQSPIRKEQQTQQQQQQFSQNEQNAQSSDQHQQSSPDYSAQKKEFVIENYQNGSIYQGEKQFGQRHGKGKFYYSDGGVYDGDWVHNKMEGQGVLYYGSGKPAYNGQWKDDKFQGQGTLHNEQPQTLTGFFDHRDMDKIDEYWVKYEGEFNEDSKEGFGMLYLSNGEKYVGSFSQDSIHGKGSFYQLNGKIIEGIWENNILVQQL